MRLLVVEDDVLLGDTLCYNLRLLGHVVDSALTKTIAEELCQKNVYDLIVLDVNLPDGNGFDLCAAIKARHPDTAIIFLTAHDLERDMLKGFEMGADDYVTKPFPISVFRQKVAALIARLQKQNGDDGYDDSILQIDFAKMTARLYGESITFTPLEYRLLKVLVRNEQMVLTRRVLLEKLWDAEENFVDEHALTVAISRLRGKLETGEHRFIKTVYGMGYMWIGGGKNERA